MNRYGKKALVAYMREEYQDRGMAVYDELAHGIEVSDGSCKAIMELAAAALRNSDRNADAVQYLLRLAAAGL